MGRFDRKRRNDRPRTVKVGCERLEGRALMSWSPLGYSLPDLTVTGVAAQTAAYGQTMTIRAVVHNHGANTFYEYDQSQGAPSSADAPPTVVGVYISPLPVFNRAARLVGQIDVPAVRQNGAVSVQGEVVLPPEGTAGLPATGRNLYVFLRADDSSLIQEVDETNNRTRWGTPVLMQPARPDLEGVVFDLPNVVQPGDAIAPTIKIANFGTVAAGPVTVQLVASPRPTFDSATAIVLATFDETNVPALASVPSLAQVPLAANALRGDIQTIYDQANVVTFTSPQVTVPTGESQYYVGVIVDPNNAIPELSELTPVNNPFVLFPVRRAYQHYRGLAAAGVIFTPGVPAFRFPIPPTGPIP